LKGEPSSGLEGRTLLARVDERIVGLRREAEVLAATLAGGCHAVLEGPPGTGKSTLLRAVAEGAGLGMEFVEGNAELTPARLIGHFDPALVLEVGYTPDIFVDGPLLSALRDGSLLYIEELNRVPEETLNVLVGALAEGEIHIPRLGRVPAAPGFRLIAAMNPFDAVGTARVSQAISDRMCRIAIPYQDAPGEQAIVDRVTARPSALTAPAVELTRLTREHPQVRMGASVRGAIDLVRLGRELSALRGEPEPAPGDATFADAAIAALSGRLRLDEGAEQTPEAIILELIERLVPKPEPAPGKAGGPRPAAGAGGR
jgi:MoxR-like ATPase